MIGQASRRDRQRGPAGGRRRQLTHAAVVATGAILGPWPGQAFAADGAGAFAIKGAGLASCGELAVATTERDTAALAGYAGWVMGFISATNLFRDATFDMAPWQSPRLLVSALAGYCRDHPELAVHQAVLAMLDRLAAERLQERSPPVLIEGAGERAVLYVAVIERMQRRLGALGHLDAAPSGEVDATTRAALQGFQRAYGLEPTGFPDQQTLLALFEIAGSR